MIPEIRGWSAHAAMTPLMLLAASLITRIASEGLAVMLVEQNVVQSLDLATRAYVLENGAVAMQGLAADLKRDPALEKTYLGM